MAVRACCGVLVLTMMGLPSAFELDQIPSLWQSSDVQCYNVISVVAQHGARSHALNPGADLLKNNNLRIFVDDVSLQHCGLEKWKGHFQLSEIFRVEPLRTKSNRLARGSSQHDRADGEVDGGKKNRKSHLSLRHGFVLTTI